MSRRYIGGQVTAADPTNAITGYAYDTLSFTATNTLTVTNNNTTSVSIFKTSGSSGWDAQAYIDRPYTAPCTIEFTKQAASGDNGASYAMMSWNSDPGTDASYSSLDWAAYPYQTSAYYVYNNGSGIGPYGQWNTAQTFYLVYATNGFIYHYNGPNLLYSVNKGTGGIVYVDSSFYSVNGTFGGFGSIRVIRRAWNGTTYA